MPKGDLAELLLNPIGITTKKPKKPSKPRPPVYTKPRDGGSRTNLSNLNPDYFDVPQNRSPYKYVNPNPPVAPQRKPSTSTISYSPNTGRRRPLGLSTPLEGDWNFGSFSSGGDFGPRIHPVHGRSSTHTGLDMGAPEGTPIYAPRRGVVDTAAYNGAYGNQIILRHGPKLQTMYGHTSEFNVKPGQEVARGDVIGYVGSTGLSTGPHLHWETWRDGTPVDPRGQGLWNPKAPRKAPKHPAPVQPRATGGKSNDEEVMGIGDYLNYLKKNVDKDPRNPVSKDPRLSAFLRAISTQESGGNYGAVGVPTSSGRAYGKYQILDSNIQGPGGWDQEALGRNIDIEQFLNTPELQEKIARAKLTEYYRQYGPGGAAAAWYAGPGNAMVNSNSPQYGGPSINGYRDSVLAHMRQYL